MAAAAFGFLLAGCDVSPYEEELVERVGDSSTNFRAALVDEFPLTEMPPEVQFERRYRRDAVEILNGDFDVRPEALASLSRTQARAVRTSAQLLEAFERWEKGLDAARVNLAGQDPSKPIRAFINDYNAAVTLARKEGARVLGDVRLIHRSNASFGRLLTDLTRGRLDRARRLLPRVRNSVSRAEGSTGSTFDPSDFKDKLDAALSPLVEAANESGQVGDFVAEVKERHPESLFNDVLVSP